MAQEMKDDSKTYDNDRTGIEKMPIFSLWKIPKGKIMGNFIFYE